MKRDEILSRVQQLDALAGVVHDGKPLTTQLEKSGVAEEWIERWAALRRSIDLGTLGDAGEADAAIAELGAPQSKS